MCAVQPLLSAERISREGGNHAKLLPVFIDELLQEVRAKRLEIEGVALSEGPGSYTGLRIGTSTAKGLCYGLNIPLIPVPTLQVLAASCVAKQGEQLQENALLCPMTDARRMEVYTALYDEELHIAKEVEARVIDNPQWLLDTAKQVYYFGDGAAKCREVLSAPSLHYIADIVPEAGYMGLLAERMLMDGYKGADVAYYEPFYLKEFIAAPSHIKGRFCNRLDACCVALWLFYAEEHTCHSLLPPDQGEVQHHVQWQHRLRGGTESHT